MLSHGALDQTTSIRSIEGLPWRGVSVIAQLSQNLRRMAARKCSVRRQLTRSDFDRPLSRGSIVSSAKEYYENAEKCFDWVRAAKTEHERLIFLQMAEV
jgi:hypothetical protein